MSPRAARAHTVVIVHREAMVAEGIAAALSRHPGIVPIAVATTADEGERTGQHADAVAIDEHVPEAEAATRRLRRKGIRVVLIGEPHGDEQELTVPTCSPVASLAAALAPGRRTAESAARSCLTRREREVLSLVARGLAAKQVAHHLGISPKTVERHKTKIFSKLGVPNQTAAACLALSTELRGEDLWSSLSI